MKYLKEIKVVHNVIIRWKCYCPKLAWIKNMMIKAKTTTVNLLALAER